MGFKLLVRDELIDIELVNRKANDLEKYMKQLANQWLVDEFDRFAAVPSPRSD